MGLEQNERALEDEEWKVAKSMTREYRIVKRITLLLLCSSLLAVMPSCNRSVLTGSKLTLANYNEVTDGMTKAQVERIMGPPTTTETKDMLVFKKTTYRYEEGPKFALFTFKNDELDSKEGNLATP